VYWIFGRTKVANAVQSSDRKPYNPSRRGRLDGNANDAYEFRQDVKGEDMIHDEC
jgi:hypothetical protein